MSRKCELDGGFVVNKANGSKCVFKLSKKGLCNLDLTNDIRTTLVTTIESAKNKFSIRQYSNAKKTCILQSIIGRPSIEDLIKYVEDNMIPNFNLTRQNIIHPENIFGPNLDSLKGKTTRRPTEHVCTTWENVPKEKLKDRGM